MSNNESSKEKENGSSQAETEKQKECVKEFIVTDQFKVMMDNVFSETKKVLIKRYNNLKNWTDIDKKEFSDIFGVCGDKTKITSGYIEKGQKEKQSEIISAHDFMLNSVLRLMEIYNNISVDNRVFKNGENLYGNFINNTHIKDGSARVNEDQTIGLTPEGDKTQPIEKETSKGKVTIYHNGYNEQLRIEILQRFKKKPIWGHNSRISTLCHELSHFSRYCVDGKHYGGMGTKDSPTETYDPNFDYEGYADSLVSKHDPAVFENAYNIEKYFEIKPE